MRSIAKGTEPASLTAHRKTKHCNYDNYKSKDKLRGALVLEQRGICCYCMARIDRSSAAMKVEHWRCQERHPTKQLDYRNLLGACRGGESQPQHLQHCDTRKGNQDLNWNPGDQAHHVETRLRYDPDGAIRSDEGVFGAQLDEVLNLNLPVLRNNRKRVYDAVLEWWKSEKAKGRGPVKRERLQRERDRHVAGTGELAPYCQVAVWLLGQRLARLAA